MTHMKIWKIWIQITKTEKVEGQRRFQTEHNLDNTYHQDFISLTVLVLFIMRTGKRRRGFTCLVGNFSKPTEKRASGFLQKDM